MATCLSAGCGWFAYSKTVTAEAGPQILKFVGGTTTNGNLVTALENIVVNGEGGISADGAIAAKSFFFSGKMTYDTLYAASAPFVASESIIVRGSHQNLLLNGNYAKPHILSSGSFDYFYHFISLVLTLPPFFAGQ